MSSRCSSAGCHSWAFEAGFCRAHSSAAPAKATTSKPTVASLKFVTPAETHVKSTPAAPTPVAGPALKPGPPKSPVSLTHPLADIERSALRCAHAGAAWTALKSLKIDHCLFNHDFDKCYCEDCEPRSRSRSDGKGSIPRRYTRFSLHVEPNQAMARQVFSSWPKAFHGTKHDRVKSICEQGYLLLPGSTSSSGFKIDVRDGHLKKGVFRLPPS